MQARLRDRVRLIDADLCSSRQDAQRLGPSRGGEALVVDDELHWASDAVGERERGRELQRIRGAKRMTRKQVMHVVDDARNELDDVELPEIHAEALECGGTGSNGHRPFSDPTRKGGAELSLRQPARRRTSLAQPAVDLGGSFGANVSLA